MDANGGNRRGKPANYLFFLLLPDGFGRSRIVNWRRERDSNPRYGDKPYTRFPVVHLRPLGHLSERRALYRKPQATLKAWRGFRGDGPSGRIAPDRWRRRDRAR